MGPRARILTFFLMLVPIAVVLFLATVPLPQTQSETFQIENPGNFIDTTSYVVTFEHSGTYVFSWWTSDGTNVSFTVRDPLGALLYSLYAASGSTNITVFGPSSVTFGIYTQSTTVVTVDGTYYFDAPVL